MKLRNVAVALAAGAAISVAAVAYAHQGGGGAGPGMWGGGYHQGMMGGGFGPGMMGGGYGPGMMGGGHGPGMMGAGYGPGMMGGGHGPGMMGAGYGPGMMGTGPGFDTEARLASFKSNLRISAEQEGAWNAFAAKSKQQAESMRATHDAMFASMQDPKLTAPDRAALQGAMMKQRGTEMESMAAAYKDLYTALTPEQRAIVDQGGPARRGRR